MNLFDDVTKCVRLKMFSGVKIKFFKWTAFKLRSAANFVIFMYDNCGGGIKNVLFKLRSTCKNVLTWREFNPFGSIGGDRLSPSLRSLTAP